MDKGGTKTLAVASAIVALVVTGAPATAAPNTATSWWTNCTHLHARYKHGLGRANARDHTKSGTDQVTTFYRNTRLYNLAVSHNSRLDADHDGVACEAH
jgi:hypothetical protein